MKYLSAEWIASANSALEGLAPSDEVAAIGYAITDSPDSPDGPRSYSIVLGPDSVGVVEGVESAGVILTMNWDLATSIAQGKASAQRAFLDGEIRLGGDARVLLGNSESMANIDKRLAKLRELTVY